MIIFVKDRNGFGQISGRHSIQNLIIPQKDNLILICIFELINTFEKRDLNNFVGKLHFVRDVDEKDNLRISINGYFL